MSLPFLDIGHKKFNSRLILGTGKYPSLETAIESVNVSKTEMVTVAIRRLQKNIHSTQEKNLIQSLDWKNLWLFPDKDILSKETPDISTQLISVNSISPNGILINIENRNSHFIIVIIEYFLVSGLTKTK